MDAFEELVLKYEKQGYKRENKKSLKYGVRYFFRLRKGLLGWDQGAYIYSPNANSSTESMREFLTDYEKYCDEDDDDEYEEDNDDCEEDKLNSDNDSEEKNCRLISKIRRINLRFNPHASEGW